MINRKAVFESFVAAAITTVACYHGLLWRATFTALSIRRKMPDAWFSGLVLFYAMLADIVVSIAIGGLVYWKVFKHIRRSTAKPEEPE